MWCLIPFFLSMLFHLEIFAQILHTWPSCLIGGRVWFKLFSPCEAAIRLNTLWSKTSTITLNKTSINSCETTQCSQMSSGFWFAASDRWHQPAVEEDEATLENFTSGRSGIKNHGSQTPLAIWLSKRKNHHHSNFSVVNCVKSSSNCKIKLQNHWVRSRDNKLPEETSESSHAQLQDSRHPVLP